MKKLIVFILFFTLFHADLKSQTWQLNPQSYQELRDSAIGTYGLVEVIDFAWGGSLPYYEYYQYLSLSKPSNGISDSLNNTLLACYWDTNGVILAHHIYTVETVPSVNGSLFTGLKHSISTFNSHYRLNYYFNGIDTMLSLHAEAFDANYSYYKKLSSTPDGPCFPADVTTITDTLVFIDTITTLDTNFIYEDLLIHESVIFIDTIFITNTTIVQDTMVIHDTVLLQETYTIYDTFEISTGISTFNSNSIKLYPNPCDNNFQLKLDCSIINNVERNEEVTIQIFNLQGRQVMFRKDQLHQCDGLSIDVSILNKGFYLVSLRSNTNEEYFFKLIINRE